MKDEQGKPRLVIPCPPLRRPPLFQLRTLAEQKALWSFPILAPQFNPPLQRGSSNPVNPSASHDLKDRHPGRDRDVTLRVTFRVGDIEVSCIKGAVVENVEAIPASLRIRNSDGAPSLRHGVNFTRGE